MCYATLGAARSCRARTNLPACRDSTLRRTARTYALPWRRNTTVPARRRFATAVSAIASPPAARRGRGDQAMIAPAHLAPQPSRVWGGSDLIGTWRSYSKPCRTSHRIRVRRRPRTECLRRRSGWRCAPAPCALSVCLPDSYPCASRSSATCTDARGDTGLSPLPTPRFRSPRPRPCV